MREMAGTSRLPKMECLHYTTLNKCPAGFSGRAKWFSIGYVATAAGIYTRPFDPCRAGIILHVFMELLEQCLHIVLRERLEETGFVGDDVFYEGAFLFL